MRNGQATLSLITNENGGIIDDTVISRYEDHLYVVANAGCAQKDLDHISLQLKHFQQKGGNASIEIINDRALLALQGSLDLKIQKKEEKTPNSILQKKKKRSKSCRSIVNNYQGRFKTPLFYAWRTNDCKFTNWSSSSLSCYSLWIYGRRRI